MTPHCQRPTRDIPGTFKETPLWDPWTARLGYPGVEYNTGRLVDRRTPPVFAAVSTEVRLVGFRMGVGDGEAGTQGFSQNS